MLLYLLGTLLLLSATPALAGDVPALEKAIKAWTKESTIPTYKYAFVDLNDDGNGDAVVLITDNQYCGSGGCSFVIFRGMAGGFKLVSSSTITREPILLLPEKKKGWHTLSVLISGGGAKSRPSFDVFQWNQISGQSKHATKSKEQRSGRREDVDLQK